MTNLGKHTLPLVLVVHVHAGEEDTVPVPSIGVNPAEEDKVLLLVNLCNVFKAIHSATVRLAICLGIMRWVTRNLLLQS